MRWRPGPDGETGPLDKRDGCPVDQYLAATIDEICTYIAPVTAARQTDSAAACWRSAPVRPRCPGGWRSSHRLCELLDELRGLSRRARRAATLTDVLVPLRHRRGDSELSFFSVTAVIGTPIDVTVDELAIDKSFTFL
jgi:hypothetical protein